MSDYLESTKTYKDYLNWTLSKFKLKKVKENEKVIIGWKKFVMYIFVKNGIKIV